MDSACSHGQSHAGVQLGRGQHVMISIMMMMMIVFQFQIDWKLTQVNLIQLK